MAESSKFFKIVLPSAINQKKLKIPEKFVKKHGNELSAVAILTVPTGHESRVGLEKVGKTLWFCDGLQQFMEHHSIGCFYFLVFIYKENSSFDVHIFDLSATEIEYPSSIRHSPEEHNNGNQCQLFDEDEIKDDDSVEILGSSGFIGSLSKPSAGLDKKGKSVAFSESLKSIPQDIRRSSKRYKQDGEQMVTLENVDEARGRKSSQSEMSNWRDSISDKCNRKDQFVTKNVENLHAPAPPVCKRESFDIEEQSLARNANSSQVTTRNIGQKSHKFVPTRNRETVSNRVELSVKHEWCEEMLGTRTYSPRRQVINQASERAINAARMFKPENPFHMVILRSYHAYFMQMEKEFSMKMKYLLGDSDRNTIKLQVSDGREWYVGCNHDRGGRRAMLSKGWTKFVKDNNLVEGDVCVFELIQVKEIVLEVSIFRIVEYAGKA